jgi:hypothetical protein
VVEEIEGRGSAPRDSERAEVVARRALSGHTGHVLARVLALPMVTCCILVSASIAAAETRTAHADDGRDRLVASPGSTADIQALDVTYDSAAGRLDAAMTFHDPIASLDGLRVLVDVGQTPNRAARPVNDPLADGDDGCPTETDGDVRLGVDFGDGVALVTGSDALPSSFPVALSPDGRQLSMSFTSSAIAGRDFQCVDASVGAPSVTTDVVPWFWFAGFPRIVPLPRMTASQARRLAREAIRIYTKRFAPRNTSRALHAQEQLELPLPRPVPPRVATALPRDAAHLHLPDARRPRRPRRQRRPAGHRPRLPLLAADDAVAGRAPAAIAASGPGQPRTRTKRRLGLESLPSLVWARTVMR